MKKREANWWVKVHDDGREVLDLKSQKGLEVYIRRHLNVWYRDDGKCGICKQNVRFEDSQVDHKTPKGMGGATHDDREENLQPSHPKCNSIKGSQRDFTLTP